MTLAILNTLVTGLPLVATFTGTYLLFRILNDFDLTVNGTYTTGGAVSSILFLHGVPAPLAIVAAFLAGSLAGLVTASLHRVLRIPVLLAGLIMSLALFTVNLWIMGLPTLSLLGKGGLFGAFSGWSLTAGDLASSGVILAIDLVVLGLVAYFLSTEMGLGLRSSGINPVMTRAQGVNPSLMAAIMLALANGLSAFGGALTAQAQGFVDVNGGNSILIGGLGAVLLGELLLRPTVSKVVRSMIAIIAGTLVYQLIQVIALRLGLPATDLEFVTAATIVAALLAHSLLLRASASIPRLPRPQLGRKTPSAA
jgi:putative ABC transport system permease protein